YTMTAWASLLPGVTMPAVDPPGVGVSVTSAEQAESLAVAPADVVARYADILTNGIASQHVTGFAPDAFSTQVLAEQDAERQAVTVTCA
ncbi:hypothetical protein C1Y02_30600, partial [Pseudomonas sp. FW306-02-F04-AA]|uniref:hypothetical protein n=1 Tax=Pseudomonas sp. FW306-02-F04-AA TaxID=2070658 RepID=UPI000CAFF4FD